MPQGFQNEFYITSFDSFHYIENTIWLHTWTDHLEGFLSAPEASNILPSAPQRPYWWYISPQIVYELPHSIRHPKKCQNSTWFLRKHQSNNPLCILFSLVDIIIHHLSSILPLHRIMKTVGLYQQIKYKYLLPKPLPGCLRRKNPIFNLDLNPCFNYSLIRVSHVNTGLLNFLK